MHNFLHWENDYVDKLNNVERKKYFQKIRIIKYLYVEGAKTNGDICHRFNISLPTSVGLVNEIVADQLVENQGRGQSGGGRKPELYGLKENALFVLSIDVGKYQTKMAIFNNNNKNVTGLQSYPLLLNNNLETAEKLHQYAAELIKSSSINPLNLMGIGINMPGLVNSDEGINYTYLNFGEKSLRQILEEKFNRPVYIENDAKAMTLAEHRFGLANGKKDALVVFVDWGIGLGIIINGKICRGISGFAGEFSHIPFVEDGALCHCGKQGCFETIASGTALAKLAKEGIKAGKTSILKNIGSLELDKIEPQMIIDAAKKGDQFAIQLLSEIGFNLGKGIAVLIQMFNPEIIILNGRVSEAKQYITVPIEQALNIYCMPQLRERTSIAISTLGQDAGILGSVAIVMENIFESRL